MAQSSWQLYSFDGSCSQRDETNGTAVGYTYTTYIPSARSCMREKERVVWRHERGFSVAARASGAWRWRRGGLFIWKFFGDVFCWSLGFFWKFNNWTRSEVESVTIWFVYETDRTTTYKLKFLPYHYRPSNCHSFKLIKNKIRRITKNEENTLL